MLGSLIFMHSFMKRIFQKSRLVLGCLSLELCTQKHSPSKWLFVLKDSDSRTEGFSLYHKDLWYLRIISVKRFQALILSFLKSKWSSGVLYWIVHAFWNSSSRGLLNIRSSPASLILYPSPRRSCSWNSQHTIFLFLEPHLFMYTQSSSMPVPFNFLTLYFFPVFFHCGQKCCKQPYPLLLRITLLFQLFMSTAGGQLRKAVWNMIL